MKRGKSEKVIIISLILFIVISLITSYFLLFSFSKPVLMAPSPITTAAISLEVQPGLGINISSPLNITYNFNIGDIYTLDLNVSANFEVRENTWKYTLLDLRHDDVVREDVGFTPNTTFNAVRWLNRLIVDATDNASGQGATASVDFFINVSNSAPFLGPINSSIFVCETNFLSYLFNATDIDEDVLTVGISPSDYFFVAFFSSFNLTTNTYEIFSGTLSKTHVGGVNNGFMIYSNLEISADDEYDPGVCCVDTAKTNITVIEINNAPVITNITVQTIVWTQGDNSTFYHETQVNDTEYDLGFGGLMFNITIINSTGQVVNLFNISSTGIMNFTANENTSLGVYNISVCVNDTGLDNPYQNISVECGQDGSSITICNNFSLTVTDRNRPPTIIDYYPSNLSLNVSGEEKLYFNITKYDPDGTIPDTYWYVDGVFMEYDNGLYSINATDNFTYIFPCEVSGKYIIKTEITDGLLNDSINWTFNVESVMCPVSEGGGGGGAISTCGPKWGCGDWEICQNAEKSLKLGILSGEDYRFTSEQCEISYLDLKTCGFQIRSCLDMKNCNTTFGKPDEFQSCHYIEYPSCEDGVKNCHDGACELLVDCGGPCDPCPTCSDGIKNQGEEGTDCGGPCPWKCPEKIPLLKKKYILYIIFFIVLILTIILIIYLIRILRARKRLGGSTPSVSG